MKRSTFLVIFLIVVSASSAFAAIGPFTTRVAFTTDRDGNGEIYTMLPGGSGLQRLTNNTALDTHASYSLDGRKIAFTSDRDGINEIYLMNADGSNQTRLTNNPASDLLPTLSPTRNEVVFVSNRSGNFDIFAASTNPDDGVGVAQMTNDPGTDTDPSFSPKGDKIVFVSNRDGNTEIYTMNANGTQETRLTTNDLSDSRPKFSRDGKKIVFSRQVLDATGFIQQIVVMNANGTNPIVLTSAGGNSNPDFSADGSRIFFVSNRDGNSEIYSMTADGANQVRLTFNTVNDLAPSTQDVFEIETSSVYRPNTGQWVLLTENVFPPLAITVTFGGQPGDLPVTGDWDDDGRTDIGVFRNGTFLLGLLKKSPVGITIVQQLPAISFGQAGDLPVAGDWDGDGKDDVGVFRPGVATGRFFLRQPVRVFFPFQTGFITIVFDFGIAGDQPVAGDWDGDGADTTGVYRPGDPGAFLLSNSFTNNDVDFNFNFGSPGDVPVAGDWLALGRDGVGLLVPGIPVMLLTSELSSKAAFAFPFGNPGEIPVAGSWAP
jgi:Tol biopolymer transport system component